MSLHPVELEDCHRVQVAWLALRAAALDRPDWTDAGHRWIAEADQLHLLFPQRIDAAAVARGVERARELGLRMVGAWLSEDADPTALEQYGFAEGFRPWWMVASASDLTLVDDPRVQLQTASTDYSGEHAAYAEELAVTRVEPQRAWYAAAYDEGRFAGRAWSVLDGHTGGVFDVATWPPFRRRGLGRAATSRVIAAALAAGATGFALNSTPLGEALYASLGFRRIAEGRTWWLPLDRGLAAGEPSRTAFGAASHRAVHQDLEGGRIFNDPLAWQILGGDREERLARARAQGRNLLRLFIAVRHRYAEDSLATAVDRGTTQAVVLGAGLDTFAYRNPHPGLRVFEVDHPATGAWKQARLVEAGIVIPDAVSYVGVDFETDDLTTRLREAGVDLTRSTFFLWLGVVPYLSADAVETTLRAIAGIPGGEVVFDCPSTDPALSVEARERRAALARRVAALGEPFRTSYEPTELADLLARLGFDEVEDLGRAEFAERYFGATSRTSSPGGGAHVVRARRRPLA